MSYTREEALALMVGMQRMKFFPPGQAAHVVTTLPAVMATHPHSETLAAALLDAFDAERERTKR